MGSPKVTSLRGVPLTEDDQAIVERLARAGVSRNNAQIAVWRRMLRDGRARELPPKAMHLSKFEEQVWRYCVGGELAKSAIAEYRLYGTTPDGFAEWQENGSATLPERDGHW